MVFLSLILASVIFFLIWSIWERKQRMRWLQNNSIPCDEPSMWLGNLAKIRKGGHQQIAEWTKKYGKVFGYYEGPRPVVVVSDVDMIKQILVKDFSCFQARKSFFAADPNAKDAHIFVTYGTRWKRQRSLASPSFSARRMKEMSPLINDIVDHLLEVAESEAKLGKPFDIHLMFQKLTLDTIGSCAFGIEMNCLKNENAEFLKRAQLVFSGGGRSVKVLVIMMLAYTFPDFIPVLRPLALKFLRSNIPYFDHQAKHIIESRRESNIGRMDFIQLMLNAEEKDMSEQELTIKLDDPEETGSSMIESDISKSKVETKDSKMASNKDKHVMTLEEMIAQTRFFILAGYETSSTALAFLAYELALNPDVQKKLQDEIDQYFPNKDVRPDYTSVANMPYFDMVLKEALRLHTIGPNGTTRMCIQACNVGGIPFRKGDFIHINMEAVHLDSELWGPEDTAKFVPERFLPERVQQRHPMAWLPFGAGPRNCIGMRFALLEMKVAMVRLLKNFIIKSCNETEVPLSVKKAGIISPSKGVWVELEQRK